MKHFMVRVAPRAGSVFGSAADEALLAGAMEAEGFARSIRGSGGAEFRLPDGEFFIAGEYARADVLEMARRAAGAVGRKWSFLITQGEAFLWYGLPRSRTGAAGWSAAGKGSS